MLTPQAGASIATTEPNSQTHISVTNGKIFNPCQIHKSADTFISFWIETNKIADRVKHQRQEKQGGTHA